MRIILAVLAFASASIPLRADECCFEVINRVPVVFVVKNRMPVNPAAPIRARVPPTVKQALTVQATRPVIGHAHVCANGHVFDHGMTAGHECPFCGALPAKNTRGQYIIAPAQSVPVTRTVSTNAPAPSPPAQAVQASPVYVFSRQASNCPNGVCPMPATSFRR